MARQWAPLMVCALLATQGCAGANSTPDTAPRVTTLVVFAQSIGRGVPPEVQQKFAQIRELLVRNGLNPEVSAWGIEGEQRLCVLLSIAQPGELLAEIARIASGVKLLKVEQSEGVSARCSQ